MSTLPPEGIPDRSTLRRLAGERAFAPGEAYFHEGRVRQLRPGSDRVSARVEGTHSYRVKLWQARGELQWSCTCPSGREAAFCKHVVAVGLAWLASSDKESAQGARHREEGRRELIGQHLATVDRERLIALLLEATDFDDILHRRLLLEGIGVVDPGGGKRQKPARPAAPDFSAYRQILREAIEAPEYVDYDALPDYAQGVEDAIHPFGSLLQAGHAAAVVDLCEFALIELDQAAEMLDGSDGSLNRVYDSLQYYHLEACRVAHPNPAGLAARLLAYEMEGGLGVFNNACRTYAEVLGPSGQAEWRRLLATQWEEASGATVTEQSTKPGTARPIDHRRYQLQALMENLAESEGDLDGLIRIKERDLSSPHDFLALAELCRSHCRYDEALAWAECGLRQFPYRLESAGLRELLAVELGRRGRHVEATTMLWEDFVHASTPENFGRLKAAASQVPGQWPAWRGKALAHLRAEIGKGRKKARQAGRTILPDHSALVEILLDEGAHEEARIEAEIGGCSAALVRRLAIRREQAQPEESLRIYREQLGPTIARGDQAAYEEAIELLKKMRTVLTQLDRAEEFQALRDQVRTAHRRKRSFVKLLDAVV